MERLSELEFMGLMAAHGIDLGPGDSPGSTAHSRALYDEQFGKPVSLHRVAAALAVTIARGAWMQPGATATAIGPPNLLSFAIACALELLRKNTRVLTLTDLTTDGQAKAAIDEILKDNKFDAAQLAKHFERLLPADAWPDVLAGHRVLGVGLTAVVGYAVTGIPAANRRKMRIEEDKIVKALSGMGIRVLRHIEHEPGDACQADCWEQHNADLFIVICRERSIRVGHQVAAVADLLGVTLAAVPSDIKDVSCLFKSPELGQMAIRHYHNANELETLVSKFVVENIEQLRARNDLANQIVGWGFAGYMQLLHRTQEFLGGGHDSPTLTAFSRDRLSYLVSAIHTYNGASLATINTARFIVGLPPLTETPIVDDVTGILEDLFSVEQLWELDRLVTAGDIARSDRQDLLQLVARNRVIAGKGLEGRVARHLGPEDWLGSYAELRVRRGLRS